MMCEIDNPAASQRERLPNQHLWEWIQNINEVKRTINQIAEKLKTFLFIAKQISFFSISPNVFSKFFALPFSRHRICIYFSHTLK